MVTVGGALAKLRKKLRNDNESLDVVDVYTSYIYENIRKNAEKNNLKNTKYQNVN